MKRSLRIFLFCVLLTLSALLLLSCANFLPSELTPAGSSTASGQVQTGGKPSVSGTVPSTKAPAAHRINPYPNATVSVSQLGAASGETILTTWEGTTVFSPDYTLRYYFRVSGFFHTTLQTRMRQQASKYRALCESDPSVNWYYFYPTPLENASFAPAVLKMKATTDIIEEFKALMADVPNFHMDCLDIRNPYDRASVYYKTDHHWNAVGVKECYFGIVDMMQEVYGESAVVRRLPVQYHAFEDLEYYGPFARSTRDYGTNYDTFDYYDYALPAHTLTYDYNVGYGANPDDDLNIMCALYEAKEYNTTKTFYHYTMFYRPATKIVYPGNATGRNALLIGDSFSLPLLELVASDFDTTFVRYEDTNFQSPDNKYVNKSLYENPIVFPDYAAANDITDVVIIEDPNRYIMNGYDLYGGTLHGISAE